MSSLRVFLRKIISDDLNYCCLCFQIIADKFYILQDEIILNSDSAEDLYEIFSAVLGEQVLDCLSTNTVCRKCTETAINSYKFIETCKSNVKNLSNYINCLHKYVDNVAEDKECYKSLFIDLDPNNNTGNCIYDEKQHYWNEASLIQRYQDLKSIQNDCQYITIDFEYEPDDSSITDKNDFTKKYKETLQSIQLSDISMPNEESNNNNYRCKNCVKEYPTVFKLKQHYFRVHAPKIFTCSKCPRSFGSLLFLNRHSKDSHRTVVCSQCGKTYNNTYSLRHHERSHKVQLVCQTCGKSYKGKQAFNNHIEQKLCEKMRKSNADAKFTCSYCDKKYSQKAALSVHIRLEHENGTALICDWCGKKLSSISKLNDHILKHTKQKNFHCDICGGKFVTKTSLLYHTRTHTGEKPYHCDHCDMRFLSASRRSEHMKRHTEPNLECDICQSKFKGQICLTRHRKRHFDASSRLYHLQSQVEEAT